MNLYTQCFKLKQFKQENIDAWLRFKIYIKLLSNLWFEFGLIGSTVSCLTMALPNDKYLNPHAVNRTAHHRLY